MNAAAGLSPFITLCLLFTAGAHAQSSDSTAKPQRPSGTLTTTPRPPPPPEKTGVLVTPPRTPPQPTATPPPPPPRTPPPLERETAAPPDNPEPPAPERETAPTSPTSTGPASLSIAEAPAAKAAATLRRELLVASKDVGEADQQRAWMQSQGATLVRRRTLANLGWVITVYRLAPEAVPAAITTALLQQWPDAMPESNQRYLGLQGNASTAPVEYAGRLIRWPAAGCGRKPRIAMLDGPVKEGLPEFAASKLTSVTFTPAGSRTNYHHGTAVAAVLVSKNAPQGLLPQAELMVGVVMVEEDGKPYTTTEWILRGLDWVVGLSPSPAALNLSFGGPPSGQLARAIERVLAVTRVVAAAGNDGRNAAMFPASHPGVIGVSAVDARERRWPEANTGDHVAIAAPGVEVWTLDGAGNGYYANGTSFATAFVTAAIALSAPTQAQLAGWLPRHARDVGAPRRDPEYGYGVLTLNEGCSS
ncbi:MAG TPA: S8 family serine peptidase [Steroidobacteraceae bacterium]|nr:S8 family serine peptidase [Steroidobacteraceae bacterium]